MARRPSRRRRRQCGRTDSACSGNARLRARARRIAMIAETNLTIWMLAQSAHAARITSIDVHHASGNETIASPCVARNAVGQRRRRLKRWQCGQGDHEKRGGPAHRVSQVGRCALQREQHQPQCATATTPPCHSQFSTASMSASYARSINFRSCSRSAGSSSSSSSTFSTSRLGDPSNRRLTRWRSARRRA